MDTLLNIIKEFNPISLEDMDRVKLQNRTDTKYVFEAGILPDIFAEITPHYSILEIDKKRTNSYKTLYYDTENLTCYIQHHNGKANRIKIRFRKYVESKLNFLEVKFKNNKGRTIKSRIKVKDIEEKLSEASKAFIEEHSFYKGGDLNAVLWNFFTRITLVSKTVNERLTIDLDLGFKNVESDDDNNISHVIIAEVKQEKASVDSHFIKAMRKYHIQPSGMSKYCVGTALLNKNVKSNNFKERILKIKKLKNDRRISA